MTYPQIDVRGRSCPEPVLLTKNALAKDPQGILVLTDSSTARDNIARFAKNSGYQVKTEQDGKECRLTLSRP